MLKIRIIPTLLFKDFGLVKGVQFDSWRRTGSAMQTIKVYNLREVDEIIFVDITASKEGRPPDFATIDELADECFMPMTVGGGVRSLEDARRLAEVGADKISINSALIDNPAIVAQIARKYGSQFVVASIDVRLIEGRYVVYTHAGTRPAPVALLDLVKQVEDLGAGEILLTSIDRDGTMQGYDIELNGLVSAATRLPVIASGGAGNYHHMADVLKQTSVSAVAAASIFHFTEQTPLEAKRFLQAQGFAVRL
ncbi:MAG: imidazole glycerol phosphate synthase subunit HisF [Candidatus Flexifilum sp.]